MKWIELSELAKSAKPVPQVIPVTIKEPTAADYDDVPTKYVPGRPLLNWDKLLKIPTNMKRLHDWYMRASSVGIDTISVCIPEKAFQSTEANRCLIDFEDVWLMMNLKRLDVQLITAFAL